MIHLFYIHLAYIEKIERQISAASARQVELEAMQKLLEMDISRFHSLVRAKSADQARSRRHKKIVLRKLDF